MCTLYPYTIGCYGLEVNSTCTALQLIVSKQTLQECSTNGDTDCDTLSCSAELDDGVEIYTNITVLPCNDPPAINLVMTLFAFDNIFNVDKIISESEEISFANGAAISDITLDQLQLDSAIGLQVRCVYNI